MRRIGALDRRGFARGAARSVVPADSRAWYDGRMRQVERDATAPSAVVPRSRRAPRAAGTGGLARQLLAVQQSAGNAATASLVAGMAPKQAAPVDIARAAANPHTQVKSALDDWLPASVAAAIPACLGVGPERRLSQLTREDRRRLVRGLLDFPLPVTASRGYGYAEVTAGGVRLEEIDARTMASRRCPGLFLVGEILDADGRIGGFNFQWAWSTAWVAAGGLARAAAEAASETVAGTGVVGSTPGE